MNRGSFFWGSVLVLLGGLFLLQATGILKTDDVLGFFWPLLVMLLGAWVLLGVFFPKGAFSAGEAGGALSVALENAPRVSLDVNHGAGRMEIRGGAPLGVALAGTKAAGMSMDTSRDEDGLDIEVNAGPTFIPWVGPDGGAWQFQVTNEVPISLEVDAGASTMLFDFTGVRLDMLEMNTGASSITLVLPQSGSSKVEIDMGAASLDVTVPVGVAARIQLEGGVSSINVDTARFPRISDGLYLSPDFATAQDKVDISIDGGANTILIHS